MLYWSTMASCPIPAIHLLMIVLLVIIFIHVPAAAVIVVPKSNCYTFDNESRLVDFTHLAGKGFEYNEKGLQPSDLFVEFCKDVERRSQAGYIKFGRFVSSQSFLTGREHVDYIQKFQYGDLVHCETTFKKMGRTAQVNIICGHCTNKSCKDEQGCICGISYDELMCRVVIELAIPCTKSGLRVFKGFTMGFHPRSSEIVYNGLTQLGFEKLHHGFSFQTEQIHVSLYLSAMSSLSSLVGKPTFKVNPVKGLGVTLTGSAVSGAMPTTLSPTILNVNWRCEIARSSPYEVNISIPVEGYDPIEFTLSKTCGYKQGKERDPVKGWATFGIFCCIFIVLSSLLCCGGFIYKSRMENLMPCDWTWTFVNCNKALLAQLGALTGVRVQPFRSPFLLLSFIHLRPAACMLLSHRPIELNRGWYVSIQKCTSNCTRVASKYEVVFLNYTPVDLLYFGHVETPLILFRELRVKESK